MYISWISVVDSHPPAVIPGDYLLPSPQKTIIFTLLGNSFLCLSILFYNQSYGLNCKCRGAWLAQ